MHLEPADFVLTTIRILENCGLQVTVNAAVAFQMVSLDITGFEGQKFLNMLEISSYTSVEIGNFSVSLETIYFI